MSDHRRFGDQYGLINAMRQHRWSYTALAREIGVSRQQLYNCARGVIAPSPELRTNLANFFNVSKRPQMPAVTKIARRSALGLGQAKTRPDSKP